MSTDETDVIETAPTQSKGKELAQLPASAGRKPSVQAKKRPVPLRERDGFLAKLR